jgi:formate hydrogenlyase transcriptional activator
VTLEQLQRGFIVDALQRANWMVAGPRGAASRLGIKRTTLHSMMKRLEIVRPA